MPLLRGKLSKAEQITVSQEMFKIAKQMRKTWLSAWAFCCVSQGLTAFHQYPNLACTQSCNLLWQQWDQALQKLHELYLGKEEEAVLRQRIVVASQNWGFFLIAATFWWVWFCDVLSLYGLRLKPNTTLRLENAKFCWVVWTTKLMPQLGFRTMHRRDTFFHRIFCVVKEKCSLDWLFFFLVFISVCLH